MMNAPVLPGISMTSTPIASAGKPAKAAAKKPPEHDAMRKATAAEREGGAKPNLPDETAYLLARAIHRAEAPLAARLEQARETTMANTVKAAPRPDLIHAGVQKYLKEIKILR
jgi:hypothetical protein